MNWNERIAAAIARGFATENDAALAESWVTCACGEQDQRIPREPIFGMPTDEILRMLGGRFNDLIYAAAHESEQEFRIEALLNAERVLARIEERTAEILASQAEEEVQCGNR